MGFGADGGAGMSELITFGSEGTALRGTFYAGQGQGLRPTVVMAHGFAAVAAQLEPQATRFAAAGYNVFTWDHAGFGRSDGFPRQEVDPPRQLRGYRDAVSVARTLPGVDPDRIGLWGSSFSGGHVLQAGGLDPRIKVVVSQAPFTAVWALLHLRSDAAEFTAALFAEREARTAGAPPTMLPIVAAEPDSPCAFPGQEGWAWFSSTGGPTWRNEVSLSSFENVRAYEPALWIEKIAPRPLLMIVTSNDVVTPTAHALEAFARAGEPKQLLRIEGGHFAVYSGAGFEQCMTTTLDFLRTHL